MELRPSLTIAIPTFNRNDILAKTVVRLLPQLNDRVELLIIDNCSDISVANTLGQVCGASIGHIKIIRNRVNVGADANIMRCIEFAHNDFVWLLGDDDLPADNAVSRILEEIDANPVVDLFKFFDPSTGAKPPNDSLRVNGAANYLSHSDSMGTLIFMSAMVLRVKKALPHVATATFYQASCASQLIVFIKMLEAGSSALLSKYVLTPSTGAARPHEPKGLMPFKIATGLTLLLYPVWHPTTAWQIKRILNASWCLKMQVAALCALIVLYRAGQLSSQQFRVQIRALNAASKLAEGWKGFSRKLIRYGGFVLVICPPLGGLAVKLIYRIVYK